MLFQEVFQGLVSDATIVPRLLGDVEFLTAEVALGA
jgi:hypothetical protein